MAQAYTSIHTPYTYTGKVHITNVQQNKCTEIEIMMNLVNVYFNSQQKEVTTKCKIHIPLSVTGALWLPDA